MYGLVHFEYESPLAPEEELWEIIAFLHATEAK